MNICSSCRHFILSVICMTIYQTIYECIFYTLRMYDIYIYIFIKACHMLMCISHREYVDRRFTNQPPPPPLPLWATALIMREPIFNSYCLFAHHTPHISHTKRTSHTIETLCSTNTHTHTHVCSLLAYVCLLLSDSAAKRGRYSVAQARIYYILYSRIWQYILALECTKFAIYQRKAQYTLTHSLQVCMYIHMVLV